MAVVQARDHRVIGRVDDLGARGARVGVELVDRTDRDDRVAVDEHRTGIERARGARRPSGGRCRCGSAWSRRQRSGTRETLSTRPACSRGRHAPPLRSRAWSRRVTPCCARSNRSPTRSAPSSSGRSSVRAGDIPLEWDGEVVGGLRLPGMQGTLERMMAAVEHELGVALADDVARAQAARGADARRPGRVRAAAIGRERRRRDGREPLHDLQLPERRG